MVSVVDQALIILSYCNCSLCSLTINSSICFFQKAKKKPLPCLPYKNQNPNQTTKQKHKIKQPNPNTLFKCFSTYQLLQIRIWWKLISEVNWCIVNLAVLHITLNVHYTILWGIWCLKYMSEADSYLLNNGANAVFHLMFKSDLRIQ